MKTTQEVKDVMLAKLDHATADTEHAQEDIAIVRRTIAALPVDGQPPELVPAVLTFTASDQVLPQAGGSVTLTWTTANAEFVFIDPLIGDNSFAANGSTILEVTETTEFLLYAVSGAVQSLPASLTVHVLQEPLIPPVLTDLIPSIAAQESSVQLNHMADFIRVKDLPPRETPYRRKLKMPSLNGARPEYWDGEAPWGNQLHLYDQVLHFKDGGIRKFNIPHHSDLAIHAQLLREDPPPVGARGVGIIHPIGTVHGHPAPGDSVNHCPLPHSPLYHMIRADGKMVELFVEGYTLIHGDVPVVEPYDFSYMGDGQTFLTASVTGEIIHTDRTVALRNQRRKNSKVEDGADWVHTLYANVGGKPTGVRWTPGGNVYVCDNSGRRLLKIAPDLTVTTLLTGKGFFGVDYMSDGKLALMDSDTTGVYVYDPVSGQLSDNLTPSGYRATAAFSTIEVNRSGSCGPKDAIYFSRSQGIQNGNEQFILIPGSPPIFTSPIGDLHPTNDRNGGWLSVGDMAFTFEVYHYPWALSPHPIFCCIYAQGTGNAIGKLFTPRLAGRPLMAPYDNDMFSTGLAIHKAGCVLQENVGKYPSFNCQFNNSGWSLLGANVDNLADMIGPTKDYGKLAAFIQAGMWGSFPRPDLVGYGLKAYGRFILEQSQQYGIEGAPLLEGWFSWCDANSPGERFPVWNDNPAVKQAPRMPGGPWMHVDQENGGLKVRVYDKDWGQHPIPAGTTIDIVVNKGMPTEDIAGEVAGPDWFLPGVELPPSSAATCEVHQGSFMWTKAALSATVLPPP